MAIPDAIKTNFHTLAKAFENGDVALLECTSRTDGGPAYAICAINLYRQSDREPEIEMVPLGLMFNDDPYEMLVPSSDLNSMISHEVKKINAGGSRQRRRRETCP
jgi:uncharacterized protein DUF6117